jgi:tRNA threonylcarbamoyladenosine biosynthesis protein TsaE
MTSVIDIPVANLNELPYIAKLAITFAGDLKTFLFYAPMGAGKTTFIKELCSALGSHDNFNSPSYSIVNEYTGDRKKIYHFDLYRLTNTEELMDLGIEEYLDSNNYCFFEWPERAEEFVVKPHVKIEIELGENIRYIRISKS